MTHTRDEIMAMSADELRIEIAKKKGYLFIQYPEMVYVVSQFLTGLLPRGGKRIEEIPEGVKIAFRCPDYPQDIAKAWELVEEIRRGGDEITLNSDRRGNGSAIYSVVVLRLRNDNIGTGWTQIVNSEADTASLAISRAWLIWSEESGK